VHLYEFDLQTPKSEFADWNGYTDLYTAKENNAAEECVILPAK